MITTFLSYGGGVQSTALVMKCLNDEYKRPDYIVFSDTGSEMPHTYQVVDRIEALCEDEIPFVRVAYPQKLHEKYLEDNGLPVVGIRSCTVRWKIDPVKQFMRSIVGMGRRKIIAELWLGISTDESRRARPSPDQWTSRRYPLIEMNMSRSGCNFYLEDVEFGQVQKSGCFCCPYQSGRQWGKLRRQHRELFEISQEMERRAQKYRDFKGGLFRSEKSIDIFDTDITLSQFGFTYGESKCDPGGSCFL